ncbi:hypothetical protein [Embleya sp. NPDC001921]
MRLAAARARQRLGRRGAFLAIYGAAQVFWGVGFIVLPPTPAGLALLTDALPLHCWAWLWILGGAAAFASAWLRVGRDAVGYGAAMIPLGIWAFAYLWASMSGEYARGGWVAGWYLGHIGVVLWASSVPEYSVPPRRRDPGSGRE